MSGPWTTPQGGVDSSQHPVGGSVCHKTLSGTAQAATQARAHVQATLYFSLSPFLDHSRVLKIR